MVGTADLGQLGRIFADPAAYADPVAWHESARRLRQEAPITLVSLPEYQDFWAITRHADIMEIERNAEVFCNAPVPVLQTRADVEAAVMEDPPVKTLVQMDGDEHRASRGIVSDWFKPMNVRTLTDRVDELATQVVDRMASMGGRCDFANDVAMPYPLQVILSILGLPEEDHQKMLTLTQELFGAEDPDIGRVGEDSSILEVLLDFVNYFTDLANDRRRHPTGDLASVVANAEIGGQPLPDMDVMGFYLIISTAGHDTTSNSIGGSMLALMEHRDQLELLRAHPELITHAADELIRSRRPSSTSSGPAARRSPSGATLSKRATSRCSRSPRATGTRRCSRILSGSMSVGRTPPRTSPSGSASISASARTSRAWRSVRSSGSCSAGSNGSSSTANPPSCSRPWSVAPRPSRSVTSSADGNSKGLGIVRPGSEVNPGQADALSSSP